jgi:hypothetical protein
MWNGKVTLVIKVRAPRNSEYDGQSIDLNAGVESRKLSRKIQSYKDQSITGPDKSSI